MDIPGEESKREREREREKERKRAREQERKREREKECPGMHAQRVRGERTLNLRER